MADAIVIDNVRPPIPSAWQNDQEIMAFIESDFFRQEQTIQRTGDETDLIADAQNRVDTAETNITTINTEITTLQEAVAELEELIVLLQKRIKTTLFILEHRIKCLDEFIETN